MPQLDFATLCDFARGEGGMVHIIGGAMDTIQARTVPTGHNIGLAARFSFTRNECGRPHRIEIIAQDQDGQHLANLAAVVAPDWNEDLPPGWMTGAVLGINFGVPFPEFGLYSIEIMLDDSSVKSLPLRVVPRPDSPS